MEKSILIFLISFAQAFTTEVGAQEVVKCEVDRLPKELSVVKDLKYATVVEKGMGLAKKTIVGFVGVSTDNCVPTFVAVGGEKTLTDLSGYKTSGLDNCHRFEVELKINALVDNAGLKFAGWVKKGTALTEPDHYTKRWVRSLKPLCSELLNATVDACTGPCKLWLDEVGKEKLCGEMRQNMLAIEPKFCDACCKN